MVRNLGSGLAPDTLPSDSELEHASAALKLLEDDNTEESSEIVASFCWHHMFHGELEVVTV